MKISYAITVCNEVLEIQRLLDFLLENKRDQDEIVIVFDTTNGSPSIEEYLRANSVSDTKFSWYPFPFKGDFSALKNYLTKNCVGDYIFQIDADEIPNLTLLQYLPAILESNNVDVLRVPRINTVEGLTQEHIQKWRWVVDSRGRVNWPDPQWRIYKNDGKIHWKNKVHEVLDGYKTHSILPFEEDFALQYHKDIKRQEKQNNYYDTL